MVEAELRQLPKVSGGGAVPQPSGELQQVLFAAGEEAETMKDDYISTEHLLLALEKIPLNLRQIVNHNPQSVIPNSAFVNG
jgi:ATP-dependent Clp protease ATP-binding subunit ClpB